MTTITGKLNVDSSFNGRVRFTPDTSFVDTTTTPDTLVVEPYTQDFTGDTFSIDVPQSQKLAGQATILTSGVTYKIELLKIDNTPIYTLLDGSVYTGPVIAEGTIWYTGDYLDPDVTKRTNTRLSRDVSTSERLIQEPIHAIVPDSATPIEFTGLIGIPFTSNHEDIGFYRLADLLTDASLPYKDRISSKFQIKGTYSDTVTYTFGDIVYFDGSSWIYQATANQTGVSPPPSTQAGNAAWTKLASRGESGGTGAQSTGFDAQTWQTQTNVAASRADVADAIASVTTASVDLSNYYTKNETAPKNNPIFTGSVKRDSLNYASLPGTIDRTKEVPTIQLVEDAIGRSTSGAFPQPNLVLEQKFEQRVVLAGAARGSFDVRIAHDISRTDVLNGWSNGQYTIPENGDYLFFLSARIKHRLGAQSFGATHIVHYIWAYLGEYISTGNYKQLGNFFMQGLPRNETSEYAWLQASGLKYQRNMQKGKRVEFRLAGEVTEGHQFNNSSTYDPIRIAGERENNTNQDDRSFNQVLVWRLG